MPALAEKLHTVPIHAATRHLSEVGGNKHFQCMASTYQVVFQHVNILLLGLQAELGKVRISGEILLG